jgi:hypothetical protein
MPHTSPQGVRRHDRSSAHGLIGVRAIPIAVLAACIAHSTAAHAQPRYTSGNWENLGCQKVGFIRDRDTIQVGRREGRFSAIRLRVAGNDIFLQDLTVIYGNGAPDRLQVRSDIRAGGQTRAIDLKGAARAIRSIEMTYRSRPNFKGQATVCVEGRHR